MAGDGVVRLCGECGKHVHDLSAMTEAEVLARVRPGMCVRYTADPDGQIRHRPPAEPRWSRRRALSLLGAGVAWVAALVPGAAHAAQRSISGRVVDRNGEPVDRAVISLHSLHSLHSLDPGQVELLTARDGSFTIDHLRDNVGERTKLERHTRYTLDVFKAGYHTERIEFSYRHGALELEPVTLTWETLEVQDKGVMGAVIDPDRFRSEDRSGATMGEME
jgi:hypothetical protein